MSAHEITEITSLLPEDLRRLAVLFARFRHDLDGALERATANFKSHMPSKGDVCEAAVRKYLSETLGRRYAVTEGTIFDSAATQSRQQDAIIFDDHWSIRFTPRDSGEPALVPFESAYATIEVKKTLTAEAFRDAIENIRSVKSMTREESWAQHITPNWKILNMRREDNPGTRNRFFAAVFAFSAGRSLEAVLEQLEKEVQAIPPQQWPDVVIVHNEGLILPFCKPCNSSAARIADMLKDGCVPGYKLDKLLGEYALLGFHLLLMSHLHFVTLLQPDFNAMYGKLAYAVRLLDSFKDEQP
jgi:hypothetical protein